MKKIATLLHLVVSLLVSISLLAQTPTADQKMSVNDRMAKARAAKAEKKVAKANGSEASMGNGPGMSAGSTPMRGTKTAGKEEKATPADYQTPVDKSQKGPNGEVVHTGPKGGKYYINKNGNKTYLSSNQ